MINSGPQREPFSSGAENSPRQTPSILAPFASGQLLERDAMIADMTQAMDDVRSGTGQVLILSGEAGAGKSSLARHFIQLQGKGPAVMRGYCEAMLTPRPLSAFDEAFAELGMAHGAGELDHGSINLLFPSFLDRLSRVGRPVILFVEDVQWADNLSLDLIRYLTRRSNRVAVLLILTLRTENLRIGPQLRSLLEDLPRQSIRRIDLPPLSREAVAALTSVLPQWTHALYEASGGNPFLVHALLNATIETGKLPDLHNLPQVIRDRVSATLLELSPAVRKTIEFLSVIPGLIPHAFTRRIAASGESIEDQNVCQPECIDQCIHFNLLKHTETGLLFVHDIVRFAIEGSIPPMLSRRIHRLVLSVLESESKVSKARLFHHARLAMATERLPEDAIAAALEASRAKAFNEAAAHYEAAIGLARAMSPGQRALALAGWACTRSITAGSTPLCLQRLREAAEIWRGLGELQQCGKALRQISTLHMLSGNFKLALQSALEAVALLERLPQDTALAMACCQVAHCLMMGSDRRGTEIWAQRAIALGERLKARRVLAHAGVSLGAAMIRGGQGNALAAGLQHLQSALAMSLRENFSEPALLGHMNLAEAWLLRFELKAAGKALREGMTYVVENGFLRRHFLGLEALVLMHRGRIERAHTLSSEALGHFDVSATDSIIQWHLLLARGLSGSRLCNTPLAQTSLDQAWQLSLQSGLPRYILPSGLALVETCWVNADLETAQAVLTDIWARRGGEDSPWLLGAVCVWAKRLMVRLDGARDAALLSRLAIPFRLELKGEITAAALAWEALGVPFEQALSLMQGEREQLDAAINLLTQVGAGPAIRAAKRQATKRGFPNVRRGAYHFARNHPFGLTAKETQVFQYLVEGMSNAEIAAQLKRSERTVEHHVSAILAKSRSKSRNYLVAAYRNGRLPGGRAKHA